MMIVADASPLRYLVAIGAVEALKALYTRVLVPEAVAGELDDQEAPASVRAWIAQPPAWCEIHPDPPSNPALAHLDAGERAAIALAVSVAADGLLMDEWDGRAEAKRRRLHVTGMLGVLADGPRRSDGFRNLPGANSAPRISIFPTRLSPACGNGCPERQRNHDRAHAALPNHFCAGSTGIGRKLASVSSSVYVPEPMRAAFGRSLCT
jgi:uncharacterized protein